MTHELTSIALILTLSLCAPQAHAQGWCTTEGERLDVPKGATLRAGDDIGAIVDAMLEQRIDDDGPGFAVALMRDGELIYANAIGMADFDRYAGAHQEKRAAAKH